MQALHGFLADYEAGRRSGRYVDAALPALPFVDAAFELALSSHFLFLYSVQFDLDFHLAALREMLRVAAEVRVFPLLQLGESAVAARLPEAREALTAAAGPASRWNRCPTSSSAASNRMLRLRRDRLTRTPPGRCRAGQASSDHASSDHAGRPARSASLTAARERGETAASLKEVYSDAPTNLRHRGSYCLCGLVFVSGAFAGAEGEAAAARASSMEPGPYGKYDPPIDVTFVNHVNDSFHKTVTLNDQTLEDNMWLDQYRERFGINIKYLWIAKSAEEYQQKLNLSMASGDIPDILELDHHKPPVNVARPLRGGQAAAAGRGVPRLRLRAPDQRRLPA